MQAEPIHAYQKIYSKSIEKDFKGKAGLQTITIMVTSRENFNPFIALEENGQEVQVTDGAVVSQKLAQLEGITVGDKLELDGKEIRVAAISENYVGHFVYLNRATYEQVYGTSPKDNTYLVKLKRANTIQYGERSCGLYEKNYCFWGDPKCNGYPSL